MWQWLRQRFIAGLFVTVPLVVSVVAIVWFFRWVDGLTRVLGERVLGSSSNETSGLVVSALGILATAAIVLIAGTLATNVIGRRLVDRTEQLLMHVPLFRTIYSPVRQLLKAFSPGNEVGFKRMVLVEDDPRGYLLGFLTKEFVVDGRHGRETLLAVYVPTNHLYLGDVLVCRPERVTFLDMTVEDGVRVFLTGGMGLPDRLSIGAGEAIAPTKRAGTGRADA
jgi:uncharacterized membrane protein